MTITARIYGGDAVNAEQRAVIQDTETGDSFETTRSTWRAMQAWLSKWGFSYRTSTTDVNGDWHHVHVWIEA